MKTDLECFFVTNDALDSDDTTVFFSGCKLWFCLIVLILITFSCSKKEENQPAETILAKISEKTISVNEFIRRAEYTIRPTYCKGDLNIHKKIVLNSFIAEKILALEAGENNEFITHPKVDAYLRGHLEQAMRQWQYYKQAAEKADVDTQRIKKTFNLAGRKYKVAYLNLPDNFIAWELAEKFRQPGRTFEDILQKDYQLDSIPQREISWNASEHDVILDALYSESIIKGQLIGPLQLEKEQFVFIKILGWIEQPAITQTQIQNRWKNIYDRLKERAARKIYTEYIHEVMKRKSIDFMPETLFKVANIIGPVYLKTEEEQNDRLKDISFELNNEQSRPAELRPKLENMFLQKYFTINGDKWTVQDFVEYLSVHPLVFRKKKMRNKEFSEQLQIAIMDMITDKYLTDEAYDAGYDRAIVVKRNIAMWRDNLNAMFYRSKYLTRIGQDNAFHKNYLSVINTHLNSYIDSLQQKYSSIIEINVDEFNKIELTRIDMMVTQKDVPFPVVVPSFPLLTTDNRLDYGQKMR